MKANSHEQSRHADPQRAPADARRCAGAFNPFTAGAAPAFLDYAQQQTQQSQAQEKTMPQAQNKHKKAARAQIIKKPVPTPHNYKKNHQPAGGDCTKR
ncbi:hypothetical protein P0934_13570 [Klebsiella pneumoniae]|nr:hypothetical protein P0934_13570 [Klebsiella pneumoniae]